MTLPADAYSTIADLVTALDRANNPNMKLAFCFEGGGARGAYHAGVLEGMLQEAAKRNVNLRPDMIVGTSVGSIVGFTHFIERLYPGGAQAPYLSRQSSMWKLIAEHNAGADKLVDPSFLIAYASGQKRIPVLGSILQQVQAIQSSWSSLQTDLLALGGAVATVDRDLKSINITQTKDDLIANAGKVRTDLNTLVGSLSTLGTDLTSLKVLKLIPDMIAIVRASAKTAEDGFTTADTLSQDLTKIMTDTVVPTFTDAENAVAKAVTVAKDSGTLAGNALLIAAEIGAAVTALTLLLEVVALFFVAGGGITVAAGVATATAVGGAAALKDSILSPAKLRAMLMGFVNASGAIPALAAGKEESMRKDWLMRSSNPDIPELFLTGANLTAKRLTVFELARDASLQKLAQNDYWVVDMAGAAHNAHANIFHPSNVPEPAIEAVLTSAAIPVAFPPRKWSLARTLPQAGHANVMNHQLVDGGVMDNSPIDIARRAGATHIVSFELGALLSYSTGYSDNDAGNRSMVNVYIDSFEASRDASLNRQVCDLAASNHGAPRMPKVPIYRIAPLQQGTLQHGEGTAQSTDPTVQFLDFNGHYDNQNNLTMNLEDWFMQGYQDARLLSSAATANALDPVYKDYATRASAGSGAKQSVDFSRANKAWTVLTVPFPLTPP